MKRKLLPICIFLLCLLLSGCGKKTMPLEEVLENFPEIVGEWGNAFEPDTQLLVVNEDGTGSYRGEQGTWSVAEDPYIYAAAARDSWSGSWSTWAGTREGISDMKYKVFPELCFELESGENVTLQLCPNTDIYEAQDKYLCLLEVTDDSPVLIDSMTVNRQDPLLSEKELEQVCGEWSDGDPEGESFLTVNADGTCLMNGEEGRWISAPYTVYSSGTAGVELAVKTDSGNYCIHISPLNIVDERSSQLSLHYYNDVYIFPMDESFQGSTSGAIVECSEALRGADFEKVEITPENFFDYFEEKEYSGWIYNSLGDRDSIYNNTCLQLKEEYVDRLLFPVSQLTVELQGIYDKVTLSYTEDSDTIMYEIIETEGEETELEEFMMYSPELDSYGDQVDESCTFAAFLWNHNVPAGESGQWQSWIPESYEVTRTSGWLYLKKN